MMWQQLLLGSLFAGLITTVTHRAGDWVANRVLHLPRQARIDPSLRVLVDAAGQIVGHVVDTALTQGAGRIAPSMPWPSPPPPGDPGARADAPPRDPRIAGTLGLLLALALLCAGGVKADPLPFGAGAPAVAAASGASLDVTQEFGLTPGTTAVSSGEAWDLIVDVAGLGALISALGEPAGHAAQPPPPLALLPEQRSRIALALIVAALLAVAAGSSGAANGKKEA